MRARYCRFCLGAVEGRDVDGTPIGFMRAVGAIPTRDYRTKAPCAHGIRLPWLCHECALAAWASIAQQEQSE